MPRLIVFNSISLDGYFTDRDNRMNWAHNPVPDKQWDTFVEGNAGGGGVLVFGRITYELMASYWPTPVAALNDPVVAERMNNLTKIVFSRTLKEATWNNSRLVKHGLAEEIRRLKAAAGEDLTILGSGRIVSQLAQEGLIDQYQIVVTPVVLGGGRTMFDGIRKPLPMKRIDSRVFGNGNVLMSYVPAA
ncbi:MAG: dihydrofolate reductase family protein [Anaerolineales bacterium]